MESSTKKIVGTLAVVAAIGGGFLQFTKGKKLLAGAKMNFALLGFRIHKMNLQEVQFAVKLRCYNPTKAPITLAVNQVVANYKGSAVAYSTPDIKGLTIGAGKSQEPEILFQMPISVEMQRLDNQRGNTLYFIPKWDVPIIDKLQPKSLNMKIVWVDP